MTTNRSGECTHPVQVRFAGTQPHQVPCGEPGQLQWSPVYGTLVHRCARHVWKPSGLTRTVAMGKLNHVSFELPIPGVW